MKIKIDKTYLNEHSSDAFCQDTQTEQWAALGKFHTNLSSHTVNKGTE